MLKKEPFFKTRRWSLTHFQGPFNTFHHHDENITLIENAKYVLNEVIPKARHYGINSLEFTGRPKEGGIDLDWLVNHDSFPKLKQIRNNDIIDFRRNLLETVTREAKANGLELYIWDHEPYFSFEALDLYPELKGIDYSICLSNSVTHEFIKAKYEEFILKMPDIDGFVISVEECSGIDILTDKGCQCSKCRVKSIPEKIEELLHIIIDVCKKNNKKIVIRTFTAARFRELGRHTENDIIKQAFSRVPEDVIIMSKYSPADFYFLEGCNNPIIGTFKNDELVEYSLVREWYGASHIPLTTPIDLKNRLTYAKNVGCKGVVGRIDFCNFQDQPVPNLSHFNEFNIFAFSKLANDPDIELDSIWKEWAEGKYPNADYKKIKDIFSKTEDAGKKVFSVFNNQIVNYQNAIPHFWDAERTIWSYCQAKWEPDLIPVAKRLMNPNVELLNEVLNEKEEALELLSSSIKKLDSLQESIEAMQLLEMKHYFKKFLDVAVLIKQIYRIFFLSILARNDEKHFDDMYFASKDLMGILQRYKSIYGVNSWPIVPIGFRGVKTEEFIVESFRYHLYNLQGGVAPFKIYKKHGDYEYKKAIIPTDSLEKLIRVLFKLDELPISDDTSGYGILRLDKNIRININGSELEVSKDSCKIRIPLPEIYNSISIEDDNCKYRITTQNGFNKLLLEPLE